MPGHTTLLAFLSPSEIALIGLVVIGGLLVIPAFIYRAGKNAGRAEAMRE